ncbi:MAG: nitroreductase [Buchananella hordeovulneris]|nr:nitroreductase [Buchananella hordeovulneris]
MNPAEFGAFASSRHSVRSFRPDPVEPAVLEEILEGARAAPSWSNTRPYQLAVATGQQKERIARLYEAEFDRTLPVQHKKFGAAVRLALSGKLPDGDYNPLKEYPPVLKARSNKLGAALYTHLGIARHDRAGRDAQARENFSGFGAPALGFVFVHKGLMPFAALDAGLMLQTLFLAAKAHGVDSCPLGSLAIWRRPVDAEFLVPRDYKLITGFALGYASDAPVNDFRAERPAVELVPARHAD